LMAGASEMAVALRGTQNTSQHKLPSNRLRILELLTCIVKSQLWHEGCLYYARELLPC
jgi:hypothetical protein